MAEVPSDAGARPRAGVKGRAELILELWELIDLVRARLGRTRREGVFLRYLGTLGNLYGTLNRALEGAAFTEAERDQVLRVVARGLVAKVRDGGAGDGDAPGGGG